MHCLLTQNWGELHLHIEEKCQCNFIMVCFVSLARTRNSSTKITPHPHEYWKANTGFLRQTCWGEWEEFIPDRPASLSTHCDLVDQTVIMLLYAWGKLVPDMGMMSALTSPLQFLELLPDHMKEDVCCQSKYLKRKPVLSFLAILQLSSPLPPYHCSRDNPSPRHRPCTRINSHQK